MSDEFTDITNQVRDYYGNKIGEYGPTPQGVDWNSHESQTLRFVQLMKICARNSPISLNDFGCGYGSLINFLEAKGIHSDYRGFDISPHMIAMARELNPENDHRGFYTEIADLSPADYSIASGIFNVRMNIIEDRWESYVVSTLHKMAELSIKGFAFNILTRYSDQEYMRQDLYYADPLFYFDYCKKYFSKYVALLHDYPLYEFTILVKNLEITWQG